MPASSVGGGEDNVSLNGRSVARSSSVTHTLSKPVDSKNDEGEDEKLTQLVVRIINNGGHIW